MKIQSEKQTEQLHVRELYLSHVIHYRHVSTSVAVIVGVFYNITTCSNKLLKFTS